MKTTPQPPLYQRVLALLVGSILAYFVVLGLIWIEQQEPESTYSVTVSDESLEDRTLFHNFTEGGRSKLTESPWVGSAERQRQYERGLMFDGTDKPTGTNMRHPYESTTFVPNTGGGGPYISGN